MAEVDYGYGETDYGYGDAAPADQTDYGYGDDAAPATDYGYGESAAQQDYGYGDGAPQDSMDYGYGDAEPEQVPPIDRRPKRRCSVTKFSLATETPLTAASVINDLRMGLTSDDCKSAVTDETGSLDTDQEYASQPVVEAPKPKEIAMAAAATGKKPGMIGRIRRRLSVAM